MSKNITRVCIVGTAQQTWNDPNELCPEPLVMWEESVRAAAANVGGNADVIGEIDYLGIVHTQSWNYDNPVTRLQHRLGRQGVDGTYSLVAGTSPQRLLDNAAAKMMRGEISAAVVVGAEAQATLKKYEKSGEKPPWSFPDPAPVSFASFMNEWYLPTEINHGVLPAWLTFALLAQARWAVQPDRAADRSNMLTEMASLSSIAARNPHSWKARAYTPVELASYENGNRPIATPLTKFTTAFPFVDMSAANILVTEEVADRWGVPEDRRVYLHGWGFARDESHIAARSHLDRSKAMQRAAHEALRTAQIEMDRIDIFDLYSCFPTALQFARDAHNIALDDDRAISLTGGLPYFGGPGSNYMSHSISSLVDHLRCNNTHYGMVTGIGMHMTKHVVGIWSAIRPNHSLADFDEPQRAVIDDGTKNVVEDASGIVTIDAASAIYSTNGDPERAIAICTLPDSSRCYAEVTDADLVMAVHRGDWVGATGEVSPTGRGTNRLAFS